MRPEHRTQKHTEKQHSSRRALYCGFLTQRGEVEARLLEDERGQLHRLPVRAAEPHVAVLLGHLGLQPAKRTKREREAQPALPSKSEAGVGPTLMAAKRD